MDSSKSTGLAICWGRHAPGLRVLFTHSDTAEIFPQALGEAVNELVATYSSHVIARTSVMEKAGDALQIADGVSTPHAIAKDTKREIAHVHSGDHSLHLCLSPADCKEAIGKAWGERMSLAGSMQIL